MTQLLNPVPADGKCSECGGEDFTLATDKTHYREVTCVDGQWSASAETHDELYDAPESIRMFCAACGAYFHIPEHMPEAHDEFRADCIEHAREHLSGDDVEIDDDAKISEGEDGTWVQAWVFVRMTRPE